VDALLSGDVYRQSYIELTGGWGVAETDSIDVDYWSFRPKLPITIPTFIGDGEAKEVREWGVKLKQAFSVGWYGVRFPISLTRIAPFVAYRDIYTKEDLVELIPGWRQELRYGSELELILFHLIPARGEIAFGTVIAKDHPDQWWRLNFQVKSW
jgi:hypothetical protein